MITRFGLEAELAAVERRLAESTASDEPLLEEMVRYVIGAGGKRIRPLAALLAFRAVDGPEDRLSDVVDIAAGLELIHTATLVHDDINDGAVTRRGQQACHRRWGPANAMIAGDFLFTKGFQISGRFDRTIVDWTANACRRLAEGEIMQARFLNDPSISLDDYLLLVERKTACFIETGIRIGAYLGGAPPDVVQRLGEYGLNLGIAFQIVDDVLDVTGDDATTGKTAGLDIRDGTPTLPSILTVRSGGNASDRLVQILRADDRASQEVGEALTIIRQSGAIDEAQRLAREYGDAARAAVRVVPEGEYRDHLAHLVDLVVDRNA